MLDIDFKYLMESVLFQNAVHYNQYLVQACLAKELMAFFGNFLAQSSLRVLFYPNILFRRKTTANF
jgi:hypothetical protein